MANILAYVQASKFVWRATWPVTYARSRRCQLEKGLAGPLEPSLPSASPADTRQRSLWRVSGRTLDKSSVTVNWHHDDNVFCQVLGGIRQNLYRVFNKKYSTKKLLLINISLRFLPSVTLDKKFAKCFSDFCLVVFYCYLLVPNLWFLGKW
jgi:hypothetical protein